MKETFLHFIWQFQKFETNSLFDSEDHNVKILSVGEHNTNAGPDFLNAKVKIGEMLWYGHVEIHVLASDWRKHRHQNDPAYENVILHVVWENDELITHTDGKIIPTVELKSKISKELLLQSNEILDSPENIPCSKLLHLTDSIRILDMQQKVSIQRMQNRTTLVFDLLKHNHGSWEEVTYQLLSKNFGFKINADPFLKLAQVLQIKILRKHSGNIFQVEALLFGVAGFLSETPKDEYHEKLMNEYTFLARKYDLEGRELNKSEWKFLRLRPANFPTVRLSQFAILINTNPQLFDLYTSFEQTKKLINQVKLRPSSYWNEHYGFGKESKNKLQGMGRLSIENTLINTTVPILTAYSKYTKNQIYMERAVQLLQDLKPERNHILDQWEALNIKTESAFESQALIELYNNYCLKKRCLSCNIGVSIINRS